MNNTAKKRIQLISEQLRIVKEKYGAVTAQNVLDYATPEESPLHSYFLWDNEKAANGYRLWQARQLVSECKITVEQVEIREYHNVIAVDNGKSEHEYVSYFDIVKDIDLNAQMIQNAKRDAAIFREKYAVLKGLDNKLDNVIQALDDLQETA